MITKRDGKYIAIDILHQGEKTNKYGVFTKDPNYIFLGEIKWFGRWRKYAFFPAAETVFETDCLDTINTFLKDLMHDRKLNKK